MIVFYRGQIVKGKEGVLVCVKSTSEKATFLKVVKGALSGDDIVVGNNPAAKGFKSKGLTPVAKNTNAAAEKAKAAYFDKAKKPASTK